MSSLRDSRISPELGTTTEHEQPSALGSGVSYEDGVHLFKQVEAVKTISSQSGPFILSETTNTRSTTPAEIPETPPSSPPPSHVATTEAHPWLPKIRPYDISIVPVNFMTSTNTVAHVYPFHTFKGCINRFFRAADGANTINCDMDKLTVTVFGRRDSIPENKVINVLRDFQVDFREMEQVMVAICAEKVSVRRGSKEIV